MDAPRPESDRRASPWVSPDATIRCSTQPVVDVVSRRSVAHPFDRYPFRWHIAPWKWVPTTELGHFTRSPPRDVRRTRPGPAGRPLSLQRLPCSPVVRVYRSPVCVGVRFCFPSRRGETPCTAICRRALFARTNFPRSVRHRLTCLLFLCMFQCPNEERRRCRRFSAVLDVRAQVRRRQTPMVEHPRTGGHGRQAFLFQNIQRPGRRQHGTDRRKSYVWRYIPIIILPVITYYRKNPTSASSARRRWHFRIEDYYRAIKEC